MQLNEESKIMISTGIFNNSTLSALISLTFA